MKNLQEIYKSFGILLACSLLVIVNLVACTGEDSQSHTQTLDPHSQNSTNELNALITTRASAVYLAPETIQLLTAQLDAAEKQLVIEAKKRELAIEHLTETECAGYGGYLIGTVCNLPTMDGGKVCTHSRDCESMCVLEQTDSLVKLPNRTEQPIYGICRNWTTLLGCHNIVQDGEIYGFCND